MLRVISVELANSFWPRKLCVAPIGVFFKCKTLFKTLVEHFISRRQVIDEEETIRFPRRLLVQPAQLLLPQQGAELLNDGVQLALVAQPPAAEELHVDPHDCADEPQLLGAHPGVDLHASASRALCNCGVSAKSSMTTSTWYSFLISNFLDVSVILRCCWMMRRSAASSHSSQ